jgi:hypothetical protein
LFEVPKAVHELITVHARHHQIDDGQVVLPLREEADRLGAVDGYINAVAAPFRHQTEQRTNRRIVVNDENLSPVQNHRRGRCKKRAEAY